MRIYLQNHNLIRIYENLRWWFLRIGLSIGDQGSVSGANFLFNILLARWVVPQEYGRFSVTFSFLLIALGIHSALLIEPMAVIAPLRYQDFLQEYLAIIIKIHFVFSILFSLFIACIVFVLKSIVVIDNSSLLNFIVILPFVFTFWLLRRACYLYSSSSLAFAGSLCYSFTLILGLLIVKQQGWLDIHIALLLMAFASFIAIIVYGYGLGVHLHLFTFKSKLTATKVFKEHWVYGRWIFAATLANSVSSVLYLPLLAFFVGLSSSAVLRAMQNLILPLQQVLIAVSLFMLPWLAGHRANNLNYPIENARKIILPLFLLAAIYAGFLALVGKQLMKFLYIDPYYQDFVWLLYVLSAFLLIETSTVVYGTILRAMEQPAIIWWSKLGSAVFSLSIGIVIIRFWGVYGAAIALVLTSCIETLIMLWFMRIKYAYTFIKFK